MSEKTISEKFKYIHVLWHNDLKFYPELIKMFYEVENGFNYNDHLFVTPHMPIYETLRSYGNIKYIKGNIRTINELLTKCQWMFFHSMPEPRIACKIKLKYQKKIIWRTWGHDVCSYKMVKGEFFKNVGKMLFHELWKLEVKRFRAVGVANDIDVMDIHDKFGNVPTVILGYASQAYSIVNTILTDSNCNNTDNSCNVLIGHSGNPENNHIEILKKLERFKAFPIKVFLILSYGNKEHIEKVKTYVKSNWIEKAIIIEDFLDYENYVKLLKNIDVAIFSSNRSYALGCISILLSLKKKLFLNSQGIIHRAFENKGVKHECIDSISSMSFQEFSSSLVINEKAAQAFCVQSYSYYVEEWRSFLLLLEEQ